MTVIHCVEAPLGRQFAHRQAGASPIKVFSLKELGVDPLPFLARLAPTFNDLPFDPYDVALRAELLVKSHEPTAYFSAEREWLRFWSEELPERVEDGRRGSEFWLCRVRREPLRALLASLRPHRRRSCFQLLAWQPRFGEEWLLSEMGCPVFTQHVADTRARPRRFSATPEAVRRDRDLHSVLVMCSQLALQAAGAPGEKLTVTLHQMLTYAEPVRGGEPAPEGVHQDGSAFIVSALVVERRNISGGASRIFYNSNGAPAFGPYELQPGEGLFQADRDRGLWHGVDPISSVHLDQEAFRSIIGLDIDFT